MNIEKILITPSLANKYLEANVKNRNIKKPVVNRYSNDMASGNWKEDTGELIKISKTGVVLDGQHRLIALLKANVSIYFHVATGLEDSVFDVLDTGSTRSAGDVFHINEIKNANCLPSMIQFYETLKNNKILNQKGAQKDKRRTNAKLLNLYNDRPLFWDSAGKKSLAWYHDFAKVLSPQQIGGLYSYFYDFSPDDSEDFLNQLCGGLEIRNRTISLLRNKLIQDKLSMKKMTLVVRNSLIIKTWNNYRKGVELTLLKFDPEKEPMPIAL